MFSHSISGDEAFTLQLLKENVKGIIDGTAADVHPPLYYLYAKIVYHFFGPALVPHKIATILPMVATLVLGATVIRKRFGNETALFYILFLTCLPCTMYFANQMRMYSLALLGVTLCGLYAYLAFEQERKLFFFLFAVGGLIAAYSHYFAFVSIIAVSGLLLIAILVWKRKLLLHYLISAAFMLAAYAPWFPSMKRQVGAVEGGYWIPEITAKTILDYFAWTFGLENCPYTAYAFFFLLTGLGIYSLYKLVRDQEKEALYGLICAMIPKITAILGIWISALGQPIYRDQYVLPALGLLSLFVGIAVQRAKPVVLFVLAAFLLVIGGFQYQENVKVEYHDDYVSKTEAFFLENLEENDYIVYNWSDFGYVYRCYFPEEKLVYIDEFDFSGDYHTVWFLDTMWMSEMNPDILNENGLSMEDMGVFGVEGNEFEIFGIYRAW